MRFTLITSLGILALAGLPQLRGQDVEALSLKLERSGEVVRARASLAKAVQANPNDATVLRAYARFLDRYNDPERRDAYSRLLDSLNGPSRAETARRLAMLDLMAGDRPAAVKHLAAYREAGGSIAPAVEEALKREPSPDRLLAQGEIEIPGPLRSFERMAALSNDLTEGEILPALARNIITNGYQASHSNEA